MVDIWGSLKDTADAMGEAAYAPFGAVIDLAQMPFDDEDDNFGTVLSKLGGRGNDFLGLILKPETVTGGLVAGAFKGMEAALDYGINRPISTLATVASSDPYNTSGGLFDRESWSRAWDMSDDQNAGQALANMFLYDEDDFDPFDYENPYQERTSKDFPKQAAGISWGANIAGIIALDPAAVVLKGAGAGYNAFRYASLSAGERANALKVVSGEAGNGSMASRVDGWLDWTEGKNKLQRPLSAPELLAGTPELRRYGRDPHVVAGLLADANGISDTVARRNAKRRILSVAMGDRSQIARLRAEQAEMPALADALTNMEKGKVLDLEALGVAPSLRTNPLFVKHLEGQLDNLNKDGSVDRFVDSWNDRIDLMLGTRDSLRHAPGTHRSGERAILRENDKGLLRSTRAKHNQIDERIAAWAAKGGTSQSVLQKSRYHVPMLVARPVSAISSLYTKAPATVGDSLRQTHFVGTVNLDDWGPATTQLNSMMRVSGVQQGDRMDLLSRLYLAKSEPEKMRLIEEAESRSLNAFAARYNAEFGEKIGTVIDADYIRTVIEAGNTTRNKSLTNIKGRSYAATQATPERAAVMDDALRAANARKIEDGATWGTDVTSRKWTVDQVVDDSGLPVHLPVFSTQLANHVPLLDVELVGRVMKREFGRLGSISKAWRRESEELERLGQELAATKLASRAQQLEKAISARATARDWLVDMGQRMLRAWKFSVLFRLGYPIRVLMDDHARMWAKMGSASYWSMQAHNFSEGTANLAFNATRGRRANVQLHAWQEEIDDLRATLNGEQMQAWAERNDELKQLARQVGGVRGSLTKLRARADAGEDVADKIDKAEELLASREAHRDYLIAQMGDESPEQIQAQIDTLVARIREGKSAARPDKRRLGSRGVTLDDGVTVDAPYGGDYGDMYRDLAGSSATFDHQLKGVEDRFVGKAMVGSHTTIEAGKPGHLEAWADALNRQIRKSPEAMHFVKGGDVDSFVAWVKAPEQAGLRKRLPHFAHDPEDWGQRIEAVLHDYIPTEELRKAVASGTVSPKALAKAMPAELRPAVHGRAVAETIGTSSGAQLVGGALNKAMRFLSEVPTDRLSRHPYFAAMYRTHAEDAYRVRLAGGQKEFGQADLDDIARVARQRALKDVRDTLFDMSAHSHAAHVMRFMSPFFAAHQESLMRWWRIVGENPAVVRRIAQVFDLPRYAGLVVDSETGEPVEPGALPSASHDILLQLPKGAVPDEFSNWTLNEGSFNLLMPQGPTNPGLGPVVQVPLDWAANKYAQYPNVLKVAGIFNPYPPQGPLDSLVPATVKRLAAATYAETGADWMMGIGPREYGTAWTQEIQDQMVDFQLREGREPTKAEVDAMMERAGAEATSRMWHRVLWNFTSPAPAQPQSRYAIFDHGWRQIQDQAKAEGKDYDWAYDRFKEKYGEAYLPIIASASNNPAGIDVSNPAWVGAIKNYRPILQNVDPALTRAVVGSYVNDIIAADEEAGEYSSVVRNVLRGTETERGTGENYYSYDNPAEAIDQAMARRGWAKFNALTASLDAEAESRGLTSYEDAPDLVAIKRAAVQQIEAENYAWAQDYGSFDSTQFDQYLTDLAQVATAPELVNDAARTDIKVLQQYLAVRERFVAYFDASLAKGNGGPDAESQQPVRALFTAIVDQMVRSNTLFQAHMYDGLLERDPLLLRSE